MVAGLQKPNFKARISSTGRATTSATLSKTSRSSGFSQAKSASAVSYGIRAQRTTAGTGLVFNPSQYNSDYISKQRHAFNDNRVRSYERTPILNHVCKGSGMGTFDKIMAFNSIANNILGTTTGVIDSFKKPQTKLSTTTRTMDGATTETSQVVTDMKNAKTSKDLDRAIKLAETESNGLPNKISTAETELSDLEGKTGELQTAYDAAVNAVRNNASAITIKENDIKRLESNLYELLRTNSDGPETKAISDKRAEIDKAKQELQDLKDATSKLQTDEQKAKEALDDNKNKIAEKKDEISELKAQKQSIDNELGSQRKRLENLKTQERKTLTRLSRELTDFQDKYKKEKDDNKKAQIVTDYNTKLTEYNNLLNSSSVTGFTSFPNFLE